MEKKVVKTQKHGLNQEGRTVGTEGQAAYLRSLLPIVKTQSLMFEDETQED